MVQFECFETRFTEAMRRLGYHMAIWWLNRKRHLDSCVSKELYASKRTIIKVHHKATVGRPYDFFSLHRRVKSNSHGGKYSWYYEKYEIVPQEEGKPRPLYRIYRYGHYPYNWE
ncbi:MAG: hypothetical protein NC489_08390 [Ruminococcus flavefaciens]|nr:hypothetical protein [Ruminococcus flavefaciens]